MNAAVNTNTQPSSPPETAAGGDAYAGRIPEPLPADVIQRLSVVNPWVSCGNLALEWGGIIGAVLLCEWFRHPALYVVSILWIGARMHALSVMMHDGAHIRILARRRGTTS